MVLKCLAVAWGVALLGCIAMLALVKVCVYFVGGGRGGGLLSFVVVVLVLGGVVLFCFLFCLLCVYVLFLC